MAGTQAEATLWLMAAPTDAGFTGTVDGRRMPEGIDTSGYACAVGWAGAYCVTAYVGTIEVARPVEAHGRLTPTPSCEPAEGGEREQHEIACPRIEPWEPSTAEDVAPARHTGHIVDLRERLRRPVPAAPPAPGPATR